MAETETPQNQPEGTLKGITIAKNPQKDWIKIILFSLLGLFILIGAVYGGYWFATRIAQKPTVEIPTSVPTPKPAPPSQPAVEEIEKISPTPVTPPEKFGYTKLTTFPGIGIQLRLPESAKVSYYTPNLYIVDLGEAINLTFYLHKYTGGSRRDWFLANIGHSGTSFETFRGKNHSGYMGYFKGESGEPEADRYLAYFSVIRPNKMLLIESYNFGNFESFKSLVSTIQVTEPDPENMDVPGQREAESIRRWGGTRQTVWENSELGLRITTPEWYEYRFSGDEKWKRIVQKAEIKGSKIFVTTVLSYPYLEILDDRYTGKSFEQVASETLPSASFCKEGWVESKDDCERPEYCYTRKEVGDNSILKETVTVGQCQAQRWSLRADFSQKNDCRSQDEWLIRAKNGRFVISNIDPAGEVIRLESL